MPDHLRDPLASLRLSFAALLQVLTLLPYDLQQQYFRFAQELQTFLGQVHVAARRAQEKDGDGEERHAHSQSGTDADIH
jgi:hypothetical protein